jgi:phasin family protein
MPPEIFDQWTKFARSTLETLKQLGELNSRYFERVSQQQLELATASVDATVKGAQLASESRSYKDFVGAQAALANEYGERVLRIARKSNELAAEAREEYGTWIEGKVREAVAPLVKATGPSVGKKAA